MKQFNHSIRTIPVRKRGTAAGVTGSFSGGKASGGGQYHPFGGGDNIDFSAARLRLTELVFGDAAVLKYDADKRTVFIEGLDEENNEMNMAASGDVSAFGLEPGESGGSGVSALYEMIDVIKEGDKVKGAVKGASLVYDGAKWYAEVLKSGLDELALSAYLQANKYVQEAALEGYALKGEIPTSVSDLANDAGYITSAALDDYVTSSMADERYHPLGGSDNKDLRVNELYIGNGAKLMFDSVRNSLVLTGTDGETPVNFAALGDVMGFGISDAGGVAYDRLDSWTDYTADKSGWVLSALLGWDLNTRLQAVESKSTSVDYTANVVSGTALGVISIDGVDKTIYAPDSILWSNVAAKPSTLAGYGITDACTKAENKIQWSTGAGGSYIGWVRIAKWTVNTAGYFSPHPFIFSLSRSFSSPAPEQYTLAFTFGWGTASVSQLSGHSVINNSIIERFRISSSADRLTYYLEYYVNTSYSRYENVCFCTISSYYGDYSSYSFTTLNELANDSEVTVTSIDTAINSIVSNAFIKQGGTSYQFLKADGSVDENIYLTTDTAASTYAKLASANNLVHSSNEITMIPGGYSGDLRINYRTTGAVGNLSEYIFHNGNAGGGLADIRANGFIVHGGTSSQFLKADGSVDSNIYLTTDTAENRYVKKSGDTMTGNLSVPSISGISSTELVSNLNADLLDGYHGNDYLRSFWTNDPGYDCDTYTNQPFVTFTYGNHAPFTGPVAHLTANSYGFYLGTGYSYDGPLYYRRHGSITDGTMGAWQQLARITDNVASATQLQTARTLWGQSFNGTGNVSGSLTEVTDITASGLIKAQRFSGFNIRIECDNSGAFSTYNSEINNFNNSLYLQHHAPNNTLICNGGGNVGIGTNSPAYKLDVAGDIHASSNVLADGYIKIGNAKLRYNAANRVLILEGIDGSAINLSTTGDVAAFSNS